MGIAVCGMHYTGMYALKLTPTKDVVVAGGMSPTNLAYSVFGVTAVLLTLLLVYSAWKAQRTLSAEL
jgi:NO-binding membrane sensor protein with MHYT domain